VSKPEDLVLIAILILLIILLTPRLPGHHRELRGGGYL